MQRRSLSLAAVLFLVLVWTVSAGAQMRMQNSQKAPPKTSVKKMIVDINSAAEADLAVLLGVDKAVAKKIIEARPFRNKRELVSRQFMTLDQYNKVKDQIVAKRPGEN